jgi:DNA polymerase III subunit epsilon
VSTETFVALDVETANPDLASICQVGVVVFANGTIGESWQSLVDPEDDFHPINVSIHGIDRRAVAGAPRFCDIVPRLAELVNGRVVASHMGFDRVALSLACEKYALRKLTCTWLDTARVSRRAWTQFARRGFGLADIAAHCGIRFRHHDALEDARAAGEVLLRAMSETGLGIDEWVARTQRPIDPEGARPTRDANPDGELFGEVVVFTGALSMPRREAADLAAAAGCAVAGSVSTMTTLLVVGDQDARKLAGHERSSKHRKAEDLIGRGQPIRILTERDFRILVGMGGGSPCRAPRRWCRGRYATCLNRARYGRAREVAPDDEGSTASR